MDAAGDAAMDGDQQGAAFNWAALPRGVQELCLQAVAQGDMRSMLATRKSLAKAMLRTATKPKAWVRLDRHDEASFQALLGVLQWAVPCRTGLELQLSSGEDPAPTSLRHLLELLHHSVVALPQVTSASFRALVLDSCPPAHSLATAFPNLQQLALSFCSIPAATLPLAGFTQLRHLKLVRLQAGQQQAWLPQLQQLTNLPSLSALSIDPKEFPPFFSSLAGQLTKLCLMNDWLSNVTGAARWEATLVAAAQCTNLRQLQLGTCTAQQLAVLINLPHLQRLKLAHADYQRGFSDAMISTLLQFPHLSHLTLDNLGQPQQSHADRPCSWKHLALTNKKDDGPYLIWALARLPLHSLTQPLQLYELHLDQPGLTPADVQAASQNLARSNQQAPRVCCLPCADDEPPERERKLAIVFEMGDALVDDFVGVPVVDDFLYDFFGVPLVEVHFAHLPRTRKQAALLGAAKPLVCKDMAVLEVHQGALDAELVRVLQDVAPPTFTVLVLWSCTLHSSFWFQLAHSFPQLLELELWWPTGACDAGHVVSYFEQVVARHTASGRAGVPKAADITFHVKEAKWNQLGLGGVGASVQQLGLQATVLLVRNDDCMTE